MTANPTRRDLDSALKRIALLRREAEALPADAARRERLRAALNLSEELDRLYRLRDAVQARLVKTRQGRGVARAYAQAASLRFPAR